MNLDRVFEVKGYVDGEYCSLGFYNGDSEEILEHVKEKTGSEPPTITMQMKFDPAKIIDMNYLKESYRDRFVKFLKDNKLYQAFLYNKKHSLKEEENPVLFVESAFDWKATPEGEDLWKEANRKWVDIYTYSKEKENEYYQILVNYLLKGFLKRNNAYYEFCEKLGATENDADEVYDEFIKFTVENIMAASYLIWFGAIKFNMNKADLTFWKSLSESWVKEIA